MKMIKDNLEEEVFKSAVESILYKKNFYNFFDRKKKLILKK